MGMAQKHEISPLNDKPPKPPNANNAMVMIEKAHLDALYYSMYALEDRLKIMEAKVSHNQAYNERNFAEILHRLNTMNATSDHQIVSKTKKKQKNKKNKKVNKIKADISNDPLPIIQASDTQKPVICTDESGSRWRQKQRTQLTNTIIPQNDKPLVDLNQFPTFLVVACKRNGISQFNEIQKNVMNDLCVGRDTVIVSPPGSGKTMAIILSSIYRMCQSEHLNLTVFIAVDHIHSTLIQSLTEKLTAHIPSIQIVNKHKKRKKKGKEKYFTILTPGKAVNLFENVLNDNINLHMSSLTVFDSDSVWIEDSLLIKVDKLFEYIPQSVSLNFVSNSYSIQMEQNMKQILLDRYELFTTHFLGQYDCFKFWKVTIDENKKRMNTLMQILQTNPFKRAVINCKDVRIAKTLNDEINKQFGCMILGTSHIHEVKSIVDAYNNGSIQYIIAHKFSPRSILQYIDNEKLRVIINFSIKKANAFLRRCTIRKYQNKANEVHIISLLEDREENILSQIEESVINQKMKPFPENFGDILSKNNEKKEEKQSISVTAKNTKTSSLNPRVKEFKPSLVKKTKKVVVESSNNQNQRLNQYAGTKQTLIAYIDEYFSNGLMNKILNLNCKDMKIWGTIINDTLRDKTPVQIKMFTQLIVALFNYGIMQKGEEFEMSVLKYLVMMTDISCKQNAYFIQYVGELLAILCHYKHLHPNTCYTYFCKRYKEYSDRNKRGQKEILHQLIACSLQELQRLNSSQKIISQVSKLLKK